ncbi:hypothetical protein KR067_002737, partial [Drosophila pandora]
GRLPDDRSLQPQSLPAQGRVPPELHGVLLRLCAHGLCRRCLSHFQQPTVLPGPQECPACAAASQPEHRCGRQWSAGAVPSYLRVL